MSSMRGTSRKKNFTEFEKNWFLSCLRPYKYVIDNKQTDGRSLRAKYEAWQEVTRAFNESAQINEEATSKQLNRLYGNMKQRGEISKIKSIEKGLMAQNDSNDNCVNNFSGDDFNFRIKVENDSFSETSDSLMNSSNTPPVIVNSFSNRENFMTENSLPDVTECVTMSGDGRLVELEREFFEERIRTQKEKTREAKARAEIAELQLELLRRQVNSNRSHC